jgi:hypothetical protein
MKRLVVLGFVQFACALLCAQSNDYALAEYHKIKSALHAKGKYISYRVDVGVESGSEKEEAYMEVHLKDQRGYMKTSDFEMYVEPQFSVLLDHTEKEITVTTVTMPLSSDQQLDMMAELLKMPEMRADYVAIGNTAHIRITAPGISSTVYDLAYDLLTYQINSIEMVIDQSVDLDPAYKGLSKMIANYSHFKSVDAPFPYSSGNFIVKTAKGFAPRNQYKTYKMDLQ